MAETTTVLIPQKSSRSPIRIEAGILREAGTLIREQCPQAEKLIIVTEASLYELYGNTLAGDIRDEGFQVTLVEIEGGEANKTLDTLQLLYDVCLSHHLTRKDVLLALGGGIIGDMVGFAAATYRRGIPFVQCPTTLLAQVDASVGGKVAVNFQGHKNMIGAFYQPSLVIIDPFTLRSLPQREFACGMAEIIKTALIQASIPKGQTLPSLLDLLLQEPAFTAESIPPLIQLCCQLKAWVVEADPEETLGIREILNLGHTFAHAYEKLSEGKLLHGEAVAIGLNDATRLAIQRQLLPVEALESVQTLCEKYTLPTQRPTEFAPEAILTAMGQDKKRLSQNTHRCVLPTGSLGQAEIIELTLHPDDLEHK